MTALLITIHELPDGNVDIKVESPTAIITSLEDALVKSIMSHMDNEIPKVLQAHGVDNITIADRSICEKIEPPNN